MKHWIKIIGYHFPFSISFSQVLRFCGASESDTVWLGHPIPWSSRPSTQAWSSRSLSPNFKNSVFPQLWFCLPQRKKPSNFELPLLSLPVFNLIFLCWKSIDITVIQAPKKGVHLKETNLKNIKELTTACSTLEGAPTIVNLRMWANHIIFLANKICCVIPAWWN